MNETLTWKKVFSGQFLFTVVTALVFAYSTYKRLLNSEQIYGIIMLVLAFYFSKQNTGGSTNATPTNSSSSPSVIINGASSPSTDAIVK